MPKCPRCGETDVTANPQGFGAGKAAAGFLAAGPVGLGAGLINKGRVVCTCLICGHRWSPAALAKKRRARASRGKQVPTPVVVAVFGAIAVAVLLLMKFGSI